MAQGLNDYREALRRRIAASSGGIDLASMGPSNFPVDAPSVAATLGDVLQELKLQNVARIPILRAAVVDTTGVTLDWSQIGLMDRFLFRNKGPQSVWIAFDVGGPAVDAFVSDLSFEVQANESISIPLCQFYKIGCRCAAGSGTVHAVAFQATAGDLQGSIS